MSAEAGKDLTALRIDRDAPPSESGPNRRILLMAVAALAAIAIAFFGWRATHPSSMTVSVARAESLGGSPGATAT
ncbi:MAG TPA: hypothetical protein VFD83_00390, partial [Candidatus Polarisedimenticolia bacterium]|nr:hypothetical protein [Candidatus Polarisedimenticolia bacterium]